MQGIAITFARYRWRFLSYFKLFATSLQIASKTESTVDIDLLRIYLRLMQRLVLLGCMV